MLVKLILYSLQLHYSDGVTSDLGVPSTRLVADDVMSSVIRNTLSVWWRLFHVHSLVKAFETKRMK